MRVLLAGGGTGGHLMPALALAEAFVEADPTVEPVLVGAKRGVEASILPSRSYRFHLLPLQPIYRNRWWKNWRLPFLALETMRRCGRVLEQEAPSLAVGTGGYVSGPVLFWAHRRGIPLGIQEQNAMPGLTTRWLARWAKQVHLGFPEAASQIRQGDNTDIFSYGNPIRRPPDLRTSRTLLRSKLGIPSEVPVVLVMGGSQGAKAINEAVAALIESDALNHVALLWSTGARTWQDYQEYSMPPVRIVRPFWDPIDEAYAVADLVVARAGAMTTAEVCAWGLPSILVPLPGSAADHQSRNAIALAEAGAAVHLSENELSPGRLETALNELIEDDAMLARIGTAATARGRPDAARNIAVEMLRMVS